MTHEDRIRAAATEIIEHHTLWLDAEQKRRRIANVAEVIARHFPPDSEAERFREALTPSAETKRAYWGSDQHDISNWTDIKVIMRLILQHATTLPPKETELAALPPEPHG